MTTAPDPDGPRVDEAGGWIRTADIRARWGNTTAATVMQLAHRGVVVCRKALNAYSQEVNEYPRDQVERWVEARNMHWRTLDELTCETANWKAGQGGQGG